jgi:hypothetical protein
MIYAPDPWIKPSYLFNSSDAVLDGLYMRLKLVLEVCRFSKRYDDLIAD